MKVKSKMKQGQEIFLIWAKMENELSAAWGDQEMKVLQIWKSFKYWDKAENDLLHFWLLASVDLVLNLDIVLTATDRELVHCVTEVHLSYYNLIDWLIEVYLSYYNSIAWRRNFLNYSNYSRKLFENIKNCVERYLKVKRTHRIIWKSKIDWGESCVKVQKNSMRVDWRGTGFLTLSKFVVKLSCVSNLCWINGKRELTGLFTSWMTLNLCATVNTLFLAIRLAPPTYTRCPCK